MSRRAKVEPPPITGKCRGFLHPEVLLKVSKKGVSTTSWRFVVAHEKCHARERHGLIQVVALVLLLPLAPFVRRYLEARADREAIRVVGPMAVYAMRDIYPKARTLADRFIHGRDWKARWVRAGAS